MTRRLRILGIAVAACAAFVLALGAASASANSAWWRINAFTGPTNLVHEKKAVLHVSAVNEGYTPVSGATNQVSITDTLPVGVKLLKIYLSEAGVYENLGGQEKILLSCTTSESRIVTCKLPSAPSRSSTPSRTSGSRSKWKSKKALKTAPSTK